jgi:hypothetical protein
LRAFNLQTAQGARGQIQKWLYNCGDVLATRMVDDALMELATPEMLRAYRMNMASQNGAFMMSRRGILVDEIQRAKLVGELTKERAGKVRDINKLPLLTAVWDGQEKVTGQCKNSTRKDGKHTWEKGVEDTPARHCTSCGASRFTTSSFNPNSPDQLSHLYYDLYHCTPQRDKTGKVSTDKECMAKLRDKYPKLTPLTVEILEVKALSKAIGFLNSRLRAGRFHSTFNVGVALTDRWSSNKDCFGDGGNSQNITERYRKVFVADPGKWIFYADLKQAESKTIAHLAGDEAYIKAHEADTHTFVSHLVWPEGLNGDPWPEDPALWKKFAVSHIPQWDNKPGHDFRFQSKSVQHGGNLGLSAFGMALQKHIPVAQAAEAFARYHAAFPGIKPWQRSIRATVEAVQPIINPLGYRVLLYGRPWDDHTYRQGLSVLPQSTVANIIDLAVEQIFNELDPTRCWLLAQIHDAILGEVDEGDIETLNRIAELMSIPVPVTDINGTTRMMTIEPEVAAGYNWGHGGADNPRGIFDLSKLHEVFPDAIARATARRS